MENQILVPYIDYDRCTGCGACVELMPKAIELRDGQTWVRDIKAINDKATGERLVNVCSFGAISIEDSATGRRVTGPVLKARGRVQRGRK